VCRTARQSSELHDQPAAPVGARVQFLGGALSNERPRSVAEPCTRPCEGRRTNTTKAPLRCRSVPGSTPGEHAETT
jgi:hypothetical protein